MITHENEWPWGKSVTFVECGGKALVNMSFEKNDPGVCYISGLSVVPSERKKGWAASLMADCFSYCEKRNIFRIDLNSVQEDWLIDFYHSLGFADIEENEGYMKMYKLL